MCFNVFSYYFDVPEIVSKGPKRNSSVYHIRILINISVYITFNRRTSAKYVFPCKQNGKNYVEYRNQLKIVKPILQITHIS